MWESNQIHKLSELRRFTFRLCVCCENCMPSLRFCCCFHWLFSFAAVWMLSFNCFDENVLNVWVWLSVNIALKRNNWDAPNDKYVYACIHWTAYKCSVARVYAWHALTLISKNSAHTNWNRTFTHNPFVRKNVLHLSTACVCVSVSLLLCCTKHAVIASSLSHSLTTLSHRKTFVVTKFVWFDFTHSNSTIGPFSISAHRRRCFWWLLLLLLLSNWYIEAYNRRRLMSCCKFFSSSLCSFRMLFAFRFCAKNQFRRWIDQNAPLLFTSLCDWSPKSSQVYSLGLCLFDTQCHFSLATRSLLLLLDKTKTLSFATVFFTHSHTHTSTQIPKKIIQRYVSFVDQLASKTMRPM